MIISILAFLNGCKGEDNNNVNIKGITFYVNNGRKYTIFTPPNAPHVQCIQYYGYDSVAPTCFLKEDK